MIAIVTGATAGIGKAAAFRLAEAGYKLILTGRRQKLLSQTESEIRQKHPVEILSLCFDVRNLSEVEQYLGNLPENWKAIDVLINNAGLAAGLSPIHEGDTDDWERMIDTNIKGLLYVSRIISPMMVARQKGHIINISSIAAKEVYENGNVYCGTKHAVDAITKGMRIDLVKHGIKVSSVSPGAVETEFSLVRFRGDEERAKQVYKGFEPLIAEDIADAIVYVLTRPPHVNINDILIMPTAQANVVTIHRKS